MRWRRGREWGYDVDALALYNLEENAAVITRRSERSWKRRG